MRGRPPVHTVNPGIFPPSVPPARFFVRAQKVRRGRGGTMRGRPLCGYGAPRCLSSLPPAFLCVPRSYAGGEEERCVAAPLCGYRAPRCLCSLPPAFVCVRRAYAGGEGQRCVAAPLWVPRTPVSLLPPSFLCVRSMYAGGEEERCVAVPSVDTAHPGVFPPSRPLFCACADRTPGERRNDAWPLPCVDTAHPGVFPPSRPLSVRAQNVRRGRGGTMRGRALCG